MRSRPPLQTGSLTAALRTTRVRPLGLLLVALMVTLTGCTGGDGPAQAVGGDTEPTPSPATLPTPTGAAFIVEGPTATPETRASGPVREDDTTALVTYTVRARPDASATQSGFVTYLVDGNVVESYGIRLEPGQSREYHHTLELSGKRTYELEVRAGSTTNRLTLEVLDWPREGEGLPLGPLTVRLETGIHTTPENHVFANLTLTHAETGKISLFRVKLMCRDPTGNLSVSAPDWPDLPAPGQSRVEPIDLEGCPDGTHQYGLEVKARGEDERELLGRILLVRSGTSD